MANDTKVKVDLNTEITERILALIEKNQNVPWNKPWDAMADTPRNLTTGKPYSGGNVFVLMMSRMANEYPHALWLTAKQARVHYGCESCKKAYRTSTPNRLPKFCPTGECPFPKKGEKSTHCFCFYTIEKEDPKTGTVKKSSHPSSFALFNVSQFSKELPVPTKEERELVPLLECEEIGLKMEVGVAIQHLPQDKAFYSITNDSITLPLRNTFHSTTEYYSTRFHELVHSTGAATRLKRDTLQDLRMFGDTNYSKEELVAEMGATILCSHTGIANTASDNNIAAYLAGWSRKFRVYKTLLMKAMAEANKAVSYILGNITGAKDDDSAE